MRALIQRVKEASVTADGEFSGAIKQGLLVLLGVAPEDDAEIGAFLAERCATLRIFEDEAGKMNRSLLDIKGSMLVVSQFTLFADTTQGRRPYFGNAAPPQLADELYEKFKADAAKFVPVACGKFGADMQVTLCNDGPVTIMLEAIRNASGKISLI
ncbi:MAG: D-tyrosyl-tRNA(Tyr) deacylase [Lentisphaerae bacterium]|nr:D-tyrosyl-tRNA(Tyr) deacylase [Lentisphaerota bacterium]